MAEQFKLPASSFEEVNKIIQGYATLDKAASLSDVSKATGVPETTVSRNSGFLVSIGVIESGAKKAPTEIGRRLGNALMHDLEDEVRRIYSEIASENEFLKAVIGSVRIRKGMDENSLRSHIAYSAGAKKNVYTNTGSGTVIEVLKKAGNLVDEDGKIVVTSASSSHSTLSPSVHTNTPFENSGASATRIASPRFYGGSAPLETRVSVENQGAAVEIKINIDVKCEPGDLDELGKKLKKVIEDLNMGRKQIVEDENSAE